jgi:hypothetical protein
LFHNAFSAALLELHTEAIRVLRIVRDSSVVQSLTVFGLSFVRATRKKVRNCTRRQTDGKSKRERAHGHQVNLSNLGAMNNLSVAMRNSNKFSIQKDAVDMDQSRRQVGLRTASTDRGVFVRDLETET